MKLKKIKNLLFTFIICLFGALIFNNNSINAYTCTNDSNICTSDNLLEEQPVFPSATIIFNFTNTGRYWLAGNLNIPTGQSTYTGTIDRYDNGTISGNNGGISRTYHSYTSSGWHYYDITVNIAGTYRIEVFRTNANDGVTASDLMVSYKDTAPTNYEPYNYYYVLIDNYQQGYDSGYNAGYNVGYIFGENHNLVPASCIYNVDILQGDCSNDYLVSGGVINFDEVNDIANFYGSNFLITFTFDNLVPVDDYFIKWHSYGGATISFYKNNSIIYAIDTRGLGDYANVYTFRTPDSFDKVVINNVNYDYSIYSFGYFNSDSYELGYDEGELIGTNTGYDIGFDNGYDIGYSQGSESRNTLIGMVGAIFTGPVTMFQQIFNFNVLGINFAEMLLGLVTLLVVIWLIKKFI